MVEHGIAWRRRARQSVACHGTEWHCVRWSIASQSIATQNMTSHNDTKDTTALHVMAWHQISWRVSGSSSRGLESRLHVQLPGLPGKLPTRRGRWRAPACSTFNIAFSKQKRGSRMILPQNDDAPKCGGAFCGPRNQQIDTGCAITSDVFFGRYFKHILALFGRAENASTAAGARIGTTRGTEIGTAL